MKRSICSLLVALGLAVAGVTGNGFAKDKEEPNEDLPVKIYFMAGQSNMVGPGGNSYLEENHPELMAPRDDVYCAYAGKVTEKFKPGFGGREHAFGMEVTMGKVLGDAIDHPILLVKSCTGGTTLHRNWRPPSAVKRAGGEIGPLYTRMIRRFHNVLANLDLHVPGAGNRGYEIAGFVWFQGENDCCAKDESGTGFWEYCEQNLKDLLRDVRSDLGVPELPVMSERPVHLVGDGVEWHHVVMTYDGGSKSLKVCVAANPPDTKRARESLEGIEEASHIFPAGKDVPLTVGGLIEKEGQFQFFDELAIWQRPITPGEVAVLYNNGFGAEIISRNVKE